MVELIGRMMLALGIVLVIMWLLAKWARKPLGRKSDKVIDVLARQQLSRAASIAVVKIADRALVIGVTEQSVQLLTETDLGLIEASLTVEVEPAQLQLTASDVASDGVGQLEDVEQLEAAFAIDSATASAHRAGRSHTAGSAARAGGKRRGAAGAGSRGASRAGSSSLDGSILSPKVWKDLMQGARDLTVRR